MREPSQHALIQRSLSFAAAFGLAAFGAGLAPDAVEAVEDPYVMGAAPVPLTQEAVEQGTLIQYSPSELEDLVSRIALYPDDLVAIVLPASTFPLQVVEAQRFLERSRERDSTTPDPSWDQSVVALLNYPDVVALMNEDLEWMSKLGDAVVNQQPDVLAAVARFRDRAYAAGNLRSDDRQTVSRPDEVIEIAPADPEVIYVPYYEPERVIVYQPAPVIYYYPRPYPVYYYSYPPDYFYTAYRPFWPFHFWSVSLVFNIGWHEHHLHVHDHGHWRPPHYGRPWHAWNHHDHRHWRDDRHHHQDHGWHDHEGDDWHHDRDGDDHDNRFVGSGRKGQGKSVVLAKEEVERAIAADRGKGPTRVARAAGSAKPATATSSTRPTKSATPAKSTAPAKSGKPGSSAKPSTSKEPASRVATNTSTPRASKPSSPAKSSAAMPGSSGRAPAQSTARSRAGDAAERTGSSNLQDKGRTGARPEQEKPSHGATTQLASNARPAVPGRDAAGRSPVRDASDTRVKPGEPVTRSTAQSERSASTSRYVNGFASQPQSRSASTSQRSTTPSITQYTNGFASQPQSRSTRTYSTAQTAARTSSRDFARAGSEPRERASTTVSRTETTRSSAPPQTSRSQQASRPAPAPSASRSQQASRAAPPPQASRSQQASRSAPPQASRSQPAARPAPQASRPAPSSKPAPSHSSKGDSGGSGERSSGSSKSSRGDGGKASRN